MSVIIAIVQQKGGAGKTPTAVHLSYALSNQGKDTLLIDLDAQATASLHFLGSGYKEQQPTVYNALVTLKAIDPTPIREHLYLLPAHDELEKAEIELPRPGSFYQMQLAKLLRQYQQYEYIVIDTPGSRVSIFTALALTAATLVIVPCKTEVAQAIATTDTMNLIEDVRDGLNQKLAIWGILPTQYEANVLHHQEVLELLRDTKDPTGKPYPVYAEPSRKTTRYNDATSMRVDARQLEPSIGKYWDRLAANVLEHAQVAGGRSA